MTVDEVISLMARLLDQDDIEPDDNFFDIGGNSIMALSLIEAIRQKSGVGIPLIDFVYGATPRELARRIEPSAT